MMRTFWSSLHKKKNDDKSKPTSTRFGFFSNPSTPRSDRSTRRPDSVTSTAISSTPSPFSLHCKTSGDVTPNSGDFTPTRRIKSPLSLLSFSSSSSTPSSPNFSLLKSKLCFSKSSTTSRCGICLQSARSGKGTAIYTAECSHIFHFSCVASNSGDRNLLADCPVCGTSWIKTEQSPKPEPDSKTRKSLRVYNDDEPLITSPISPGGFNTIHEDEEDNGDFRGFPSPLKLTDIGHVEVTLASDSAIVAVNKGHVTSTVTMKIKSPPLTTAIRSPVDLVTVLDVSGSKNIETVKKSMKILISSLRENDRLSMVSFSSSSKRLTPLKRMTANGKRIARRIVDEINGGGDGMSVNDAVKKAVKVIEDRRQKNIFTAIFVLTDRNGDSAHQAQHELVSSTRVSYLDIAKHTILVGAFREDAFAKRVDGLLRFSVQDLTLKLGLVSGSGQGEITSVYSLSGRQDWFGSGLIRLSDMYSDEVREVLVELKSAVTSSSSSSRSHRIMTVQSRHVDPTTQEVRTSLDRALLIPRPIAVRSSTPSNIVRLRNRHVSTRAVAESRRLIEAGDYSGAERMLTSARALLVQYGLTLSDVGLRGLDYELENLNRMRGRHVAVKSPEPVVMKTEPLTPTSAWRAAERLAKVAIMRKHMNRVSDLHGFENARF